MDGRITNAVRWAGLAVALCLGFGAGSASAAVRLASPGATDTTGTCLVTACRLDRAVSVAQSGDEVELTAGTYTVAYPVSASVPVTIRPVDNTQRPNLVAQAGLATPTLALAAGGTVSGLDVEAGADVAVQLAGGAKGTGLKLRAGATADAAARVVSAPSASALVSSVAFSQGKIAVDMIDPATNGGGAALVNVTAVTVGSASWGVTTDLAAQSPVLTNVIARGTSKDLHGRSGTQPISISWSNFTAANSANFTDAGNNQTASAVIFADQTNGDLRLTTGAAPIDAGVADVLSATTLDPSGNTRLFGLAIDIGAYEFGSSAPLAPFVPTVPVIPPVVPPAAGGGGAGTTTTTTDGGTATDAATPRADTTTAAPAPAVATPLPLPALAPPVLAERVAVDAASGTPTVRLPGTNRFVPLTDAASVPVGSTVDATNGHVSLTSVRDSSGQTQTGEFWGGVFVVRQSRGGTPYTDLALTGGDFRGCPKVGRKGAVMARSAAKRKKGTSVVRSLWGKDDKGRFRTQGRDSVATVRGTIWLVQDRCDGTRTTVKQGAVSVRPKRGGKAVLVKAGASHLVRRR